MPNMSGHMAIAKRVSEILNINDANFYKGNLLPDLYTDKVKSHYKIQGKIYLIPDIPKVAKELDLSDNKNLGILSHLLLDKYFFDDYLPQKYDINIFDNGDKKVYKDYDILNKDIVSYFNLDINYIISSLSNFEEEIEQTKLETNINCLKINKDGVTSYLDKDDFICFLNEISFVIADDLKNYLKLN